MRLNVTFQSNYVVDAVMGALRPESRAEVNSVAGRAVMNHVQRHIRSYMRTKHTSAHMLVRVPIPGLKRAWEDVEIRPGPGKDFLTLPKAAIAYGRKVAEVRALGWKVFRPAAQGAHLTQKSPRRYSEYQNIYLGYKGDEAPTILYTLVGGVVQRRDPSLLPPQGEIAATGWDAIWKHIQKAVAKARQGGLK